MTSSNKLLFQLLDTYARAHYQCFLAEMFLNKSGAAYTLCFRPMVSKDSPAQNDCRYLYLEVLEAKVVEQQNSLGAAAKALLDKELATL